MNFVEERILAQGIVKEKGVLKVDAFLNHNLDMQLMDEVGKEFARRFAGVQVDKVLTIEASGIPVACSVARELGCDVIVAKKTRSMKLDGEVFVAEVLSFNHKNINTIVVAKKFLKENDHILIIDDIMANGCVMQGLVSIVEDAEAIVEGCGVVIEKAFQEGGDRIRNLGYRLEALASIESMNAETGEVVFR